ncbi:MCE family protein [Mycobacterium sp. AZCC_0083]|uniref:MCE family protein n=1 Tax=Mycobacterium sp. AZCC_0083 TaxID=2735882 RepID=UPI00161173D4|nr:MCE family protein [Mycobacterium sp. AZCC_0083]MBB5165331.1 phospholipid/cholesterol/gamma-HCH transport system substrate-binding protein [Mycobacterium sp. AZCC_0083]
MSRNFAGLKFAVFAVVMAVLTGMIFLVFSQYRTGSALSYTAVFKDASNLRHGDTVRVAGVRVGTVDEVALRPDKSVLVSFDAGPKVVITDGTKAAVRYLNLTGDRYLELLDSPGSTRIQPPGSQIPVDRTAAALDLDLLLGGLKPVIQALNPQDVNALSASLIQILQGQGGTIESLMSKSSSFTSDLADNRQVVQQLIDHLNEVLSTLGKDGDDFSVTIDKLQQLAAGLSTDRDPIGAAIESLDNGTASLADLLTQGRAPLTAALGQLNRLAPVIDNDKDKLDVAIQKLPSDYRKYARVGSYGAFLQQYICGITVRVSDVQGGTAVFPWIKQTTGRCADP